MGALLFAVKRIEELERALAAANARAEDHGVFCPHCNPCRHSEKLKEYDTVLRGLASFVAAGGFDSVGLISAATADEKIRWGITHLIEAERTAREEAEQDIAAEMKSNKNIIETARYERIRAESAEQRVKELERIPTEHELACALEVVIDGPGEPLTPDERRKVWQAVGVLRAQLAAAQKDAERYRWMRDPATTTAAIGEIMMDDRNPPYLSLKVGNDLDAAIDAARKGEK